MLFLGQSEVDITKPLWSKKTGVFKRWQLRQTFFCNEDTSIRANVVSLKQAACYIETFSSLLTTAQEILPGAINSYKLNKAGINVDIVLSSRHIGQRAVSNRCSWKQHRSPPSNKPERSWDSEQPTFIQCISAYTAGLTLKYTLCYSNFTHTHTRLHGYCLKAEHAYKNTQLQPVGQCCWVETSSKEQKKLTCRHL